MIAISLRWRIFLFYLIFGLIPIVAVSYFSLDAYTRSIMVVTENHVTELVQQIADQTEALCYYLHKDVERLSNLPYVQLLFLEFQSPQRLRLIQEKLERFRNDSEIINCIMLFSNDAHLLVKTPSVFERKEPVVSAKDFPAGLSNRKFFHKELLSDLSK